MRVSSESSKEKETDFRQPLESFRPPFENFIFFHMGSDATVEMQPWLDGIRVRVEHSRIRPLRFRLRGSDLKKLLEDPRKLEDFLLDQLTLHRRS